MGAFTRFYFKPGENELVRTEIHITPDTRSAIHGYVRDTIGKAVCDAHVMLFESTGEDLLLVNQAFTDDTGLFAFGPLKSGTLYHIKVFKNAIKIRELEICPEAPPSAEARAPQK